MATTLNSGRKVVATAGSAEQLSTGSPVHCSGISVTAETDNTGVVVVGDSTVVAALATRKGTPLNAGDTINLALDQLSDVWLDVTVNGDGVTYNVLSGT